MAKQRGGNSNKIHRDKRLAKLFFSSSYFLLITYIVFFARRRRHLSSRQVNLVPFRDNINTFKHLGVDDHHESIDFYTNLLGNILMFIPISIIFISILRIRNRKAVIFYSWLLSMAIEAIQWIFKIGVADIDDVILNTAGALLGLVVYAFFKRYRCRPAGYRTF